MQEPLGLPDGQSTTMAAPDDPGDPPRNPLSPGGKELRQEIPEGRKQIVAARFPRQQLDLAVAVEEDQTEVEAARTQTMSPKAFQGMSHLDGPVYPLPPRGRWSSLGQGPAPGRFQDDVIPTGARQAIQDLQDVAMTDPRQRGQVPHPGLEQYWPIQLLIPC
jgi:hypothetical protein